jgi:hypothetical protein
MTISAPPMNALDTAMRAEFATQLEKLERDGGAGACNAICQARDQRSCPPPPISPKACAHFLSGAVRNFRDGIDRED